MTKTIRLGQCWVARLSKCEIVVRLEEDSPKGGWTARSLSHGRQVWIRNAEQLIYQCDANGIQIVADETEPNRRSTAMMPILKGQANDTTLPVREPLHVKRQASKPVQASTLLDAAIIVLRERRQGMSTKEIIEVVLEKGLWTPSGKTPWLTLHTALSREIESKGASSRFKKGKHRGQFLLR
jgi:hypothetical protein